MNTNHWQQIKLGDVCTPRKGFTYKSDDYSNQKEGQIFITLKCIAKGGGFNAEGIKFIKKIDKTEKLHSGDLIIANTDLTRAGDVIGAPLFVPKLNGENEYVYSMDISKLEVDNSKLDQKYLYQYLLTSRARNYMKGISSGSTVLHLKLNLVNKLTIPLPKLETQTKIANILTVIDKTIQNTDQIIQKTEKLKIGLVAEIVKNIKSGQKYKIKDISEVTSSKRVMVSDYVEAGIPFYRSTEIIKKSKNIPVTDTLYISIEKFNSMKERFGAPGKGDILITAVGTIGDVYLVQDETFYFKDGNLVWIRKLKDFVQPDYLKIIISSSYYRDKLNNISGGSSQRALTIKKLEDVEVPIPLETEQKRIVDILSSVDEKIHINQSIKTELSVVKNGLMQDIFSQKVQIN